jgi:carbon monoxide dehydrogenase subunit G
MASIYKEFLINASPQFIWAAIKDVGAVHARLAKGFVTDTKLEGDTRTVTFSNGFVVQEQVVSIDEEARRFVYRAMGGRASHHNAYFQVFPMPDGKSKLLWVTDLLPDEMRAPIEQMVVLGIGAIQRTLEASYRSAK